MLELLSLLPLRKLVAHSHDDHIGEDRVMEAREIAATKWTAVLEIKVGLSATLHSGRKGGLWLLGARC